MYIFIIIYLHRGAILTASNLYCYGDIIIEKYAMIRSRRKQHEWDKSNNIKIKCKGNFFNRGLISTRHNGWPLLATDSGDIVLKVDGVIDSSNSRALLHRSGLVSSKGWFDGATCKEKHYGSDGKCIVNGHLLNTRFSVP